MVDTVKVMLKPNKDVAGKTHQALNMSSRQLNKLIRAFTQAEPGTVFSGQIGDLQVEITRRRPALPKEEASQVGGYLRAAK